MIPENAPTNAKMQILDNSHEYPGNAQNPQKIQDKQNASEKHQHAPK